MKNLVLIASLLFSASAFAQMKMTEIAPGSIYQKIGLKNGDVVKKIDGSPVSSINELTASLSNIKDHHKVKLLIERDGKEEIIHYTVK